MPFPLAEAAGVDVAGLGIDHFALAVWVVVGPTARVGIAVCEAHVALSGFQARDKCAGVGVADRGDQGALAMGAAVSDRTREIGGGEVRTGQVGFEVSRVTGAALITEEAWNSCRLASCCETSDTGSAVRYQDLGFHGIRTLTLLYWDVSARRGCSSTCLRCR